MVSAGAISEDAALPQARVRATLLMRGLPHFVRMLAPVLSSEELWFEPSGTRKDLFTLRQFLRAHAVYYIAASASRAKLASLALMLGKPVVMHWVGSDVLNALAEFAAGQLSRRLVRSCVHWTEVPWTAQELASVGIRAEVVPLTSVGFPEVVPPLPREFRILSYVGARPDFYGFEHLRHLAEDFPQVTVLVLGHSALRQQDVLGNMKLIGHVQNTAEYYAQCTVYVRMTKHDGLSFMVLESLAHGRHVIWTYPFEGVLQAKAHQDLRQHIERLLVLHRKGELALNSAGVQFVRREYHPEKVVDNLRRRMMEVIERRCASARADPPA